MSEWIKSHDMAPVGAVVVSKRLSIWADRAPRPETVVRHTRTQIVTDRSRYAAKDGIEIGGMRRLYVATDEMATEIEEQERKKRAMEESRVLRAEIAELISKPQMIRTLRNVRNALRDGVLAEERQGELQAVE